MSFKAINELRQANKLEEAKELAEQSLLAAPDDIWIKRAAGWVYYAFLKKHTDTLNTEESLVFLQKIKALQLTESDAMIFDSCAWQVGRLVFGLKKIIPVDQVAIDALLEAIRQFHFSKPSEAYTFLYKAFHKGYSDWAAYLDFADWWNFKNFLPADYLPEKYEGTKRMAIVEQAYIAYAKMLLTELQDQPDPNRIQAFLSALDQLILTQNHYQYPRYYQVKLLLALGKHAEALDSFLPFARQKQNEFWVWQLMADLFATDPDLQFSCYCKALSLKTRDDFLVKIRQQLVEILLQKQWWAEAKTEIKIIIFTRNKHGWNIPEIIKDWCEADWYAPAVAKKNNTELYQNHLANATALLYHDLPEETIAVSFVHTKKNIIHFIRDKEKYGFFKYNHCPHPLLPGDTLRVRFIQENKGAYYKIASLSPTSNTCPAVQEFEGLLKLHPSGNFGFVKQVFISPQLLQTQQIKAGQTVRGIAILSFDKKKSKWGWKAVRVKSKER